MKVHLIGIGGAGLSAIATVLLQQNHSVSGSDIQASSTTERLAGLGAQIFIGHRPENLNAGEEPIEAVVVSSAIAADNVELLEARRRGLAVFKRAEWLGRMMKGRIGVAIAGTHGKTTTTAMTAFLLREAGQDPTFIIGGFMPQLDTSAAAGKGQTFVVEADEYDHTFLGLHPDIAVVTVVEWDHPDIYPTPASFTQAFEAFVRLVPAKGAVIGCGDEAGVLEVLTQSKAKVITYGLRASNHVRAVEIRPNRRGGSDFKVVERNGPVVDASGDESKESVVVSLATPGLHNVRNALAALIVGREQGIGLPEAAEILSRYQGVGRRFELKGEINGITVIDDYAHHPTEVKATLAAARSRFENRPLWVVFQPHTFSRTISLLNDFVTAFNGADHVIVVDIFASRERDQGLISSRDLVNRMSHADVRYIGPLVEAVDYLAVRLSPPAVLLTMGAGDGYRVGEGVLERLAGNRR